ncbi:MAG: two-component system response regulator [Deltaproteobacteria bacterium]|jgi:putative two-component system response regulator|nr:two-component system response regulator [Deltaproteobacteria bacterium]MBT4525347.1 two-component system response regulator [Deltaproteobacteria bacterium]
MNENSNCNILVVDDTEANIDILVDALSPDYEVSVAMDGQSALDDVKENIPDLILLDIMMPGMDGYEVCRQLKENPETHHIPIVFLTAMTGDEDEAKGLGLGAIDYITKPFNQELVKSRIKNHLELKLLQDHLEKQVRLRTKQLEQTQEATIITLATLAEYRDPETGGHIKRTQNYVQLLAKSLQTHDNFKSFLTDDFIELLYKSAPLHDIGKVGVPDHILLKPGKLTDEEFVEMKKHTIYGRNSIAAAEKMLGDDSFLKIAKEIAEFHQEKWDGSGYPHSLKGEDIPISARLMAIADVYDALISKRVYKPPFTHTKAVNIIKEGSGSHFDPIMVATFEKITEQFRNAALEFADFEEERLALQA